MRLQRRRMLELLQIRKMSAATLAAALGVSKQFISQVLSGGKKLSLKRSRQVIELFGADDIAFVIDWDGMGIKNPFTGAV